MMGLQRVVELWTLMCFTGGTADSDEGAVDAACHFVGKRFKIWGKDDHSDLF